MIKDLSNRYATTNIFAPEEGYVEVIEMKTKDVIALFCVSKTEGTGVKQSVHMSYWAKDGSAILVANLHGKMIERIHAKRNSKTGKIANIKSNQSTAVYLGNDFTLLEGATYFKGENVFGRDLVGKVVGSYDGAGEFRCLFFH